MTTTYERRPAGDQAANEKAGRPESIVVDEADTRTVDAPAPVFQVMPPLSVEELEALRAASRARFQAEEPLGNLYRAWLDGCADAAEREELIEVLRSNLASIPSVSAEIGGAA